MQLLNLLPLVALASAIVIPDESVTRQIVLEGEKSQHNRPSSAKGIFHQTLDRVRDVFDDAVEKTREIENQATGAFEELKLDAAQWLNSAKGVPSNVASAYEKAHASGLSGLSHHHKPNKTIYELISESKYTTKFAELLKDFPEAVKVLNGSESNITYFVPTNRAFEKIPEHHKKPSHEMLEKLLMYHGSPDFYPAGRVLASHTLPSALNLSVLDDNPQRLRVGLTLRGLTVNFLTRIIAINIVSEEGRYPLRILPLTRACSLPPTVSSMPSTTSSSPPLQP